MRAVSHPDRPAIRACADGPTKPELLGSACPVAVSTQAANVAVVVAATLGERHDVVRYGRLSDYPGAGTIATEGFCL